MNNIEKQNKIEAKEEDRVLEFGIVKKENHPISNHVMKTKSKIIVHSVDKEENKTKIKEEGVMWDIILQNEDDLPSSDTLKVENISDMNGMFSTIEIKGEPCWQEAASPEAKCHPKSPSVSECEMFGENEDGANEGLSAAQSIRLNTEAASSGCSSTCLFIGADIEENSLKCEHTNPEFSGAAVHEVLKTHKRKVPYKCDLCEKSFSRKGDLKTHNLIHEGNRPNKCDVCEKSFTRKGDLNRHSLIHDGIRPYKCDVCKKSFTQMGALKRHMANHEGKRPHKCSICAKTFTRRGILKSHTLIHEGKKPYKCEVCKRSFSWKGALRRHYVIHEGKRPFKCDVCEKSFSWKAGLRRHYQVHEDKRS